MRHPLIETVARGRLAWVALLTGRRARRTVGGATRGFLLALPRARATAVVNLSPRIAVVLRAGRRERRHDRVGARARERERVILAGGHAPATVAAGAPRGGGVAVAPPARPVAAPRPGGVPLARVARAHRSGPAGFVRSMGRAPVAPASSGLGVASGRRGDGVPPLAPPGRTAPAVAGRGRPAFAPVATAAGPSASGSDAPAPAGPPAAHAARAAHARLAGARRRVEVPRAQGARATVAPPALPASQVAGRELATGFPSSALPAAALPPAPAAAAVLETVDVARLTDQVVRQIDRRIVAHRERLGRI